MAITSVAPIENRMIAVSYCVYTRTDVYKRQDLWEAFVRDLSGLTKDERKIVARLR